jgi:hypothetical protein
MLGSIMIEGGSGLYMSQLRVHRRAKGGREAGWVQVQVQVQVVVDVGDLRPLAGAGAGAGACACRAVLCVHCAC